MHCFLRFEKSDINIVLSHAGNEEDHKLAQVPGVSAVIGADTHKVIETPEYEFNGEVMVPITQAGGEQENKRTRTLFGPPRSSL